jgi:hypothetical protein
MSADIVERLRRIDPDWSTVHEVVEVQREAAAEIERLRAALRECWAAAAIAVPVLKVDSEPRRLLACACDRARAALASARDGERGA